MRKIYMERLVLLSALIFLTLQVSAQTFYGGTGNIDNDGQNTTFSCSVSGLPQSTLDPNYGLEEVCLTINHTAVRELVIVLESPSGRRTELTSVNGGNDDNFTSTCFNSTAADHITTATAPFTGTFRPEGFLGKFNEYQSGNGTWKLHVKDWMINLDTGVVSSWSIKFGNSPAAPLFFSSSDLPIVVLETNGTTIKDEPKVTIEMGIIYNGAGVRNNLNDPKNHYNGKIAVEYRGSSSQQYEKKSLSIETLDATGIEAKVSLLGMPAEVDWVLYASYLDRSLLRNYLTYGISRKMGNYAVRGKFVELVIDDEYRGVYVLMEKIKRDGDRVDISKLEPTENTGDDLTGGYIIKLDKMTGNGGGGWYSNYQGNTGNVYFQYHYPKDDIITTAQADYIKAYVDSFENALNGSDFKDPEKGYKKYADLNSLVDYFIMTEVARNIDGYRLSTYIYKDKYSKGGKLKIGPLWDFDLAWGNCEHNNGNLNWGWHYSAFDTEFPYPSWWTRLMEDSEFKNAVKCRYDELRSGTLSNTTFKNYVDSIAGALQESQERNFTVWPTLGTKLYPTPYPAPTDYNGEVAMVKDWFYGRMGWLDSNIPGICTVGDEEEETPSVMNLKVYPNPSKHQTTFEFILPVEREMTLTVYDVSGKAVINHESKTYSAGSHKIELVHNLSPGFYTYKVGTEKENRSGKIVISN